MSFENCFIIKCRITGVDCVSSCIDVIRRLASSLSSAFSLISVNPSSVLPQRSYLRVTH